MTSYQHPTKISGYDVVCIGKGEMGYVYKATMPVLDPHVLPVTFAFKTIRPDDKMRAEILAFESRMAVDVRASQRLKHENVVRVDGIGEDDKLRLKYIMMEYVDGKNLKQLTDSSFPPAFETVKSIIVQLLSALQHVHEHHVIHRDIKPANVMLTRDGKVKLVDFGIALIDEPNDATRTKPEIVGTPDYMAPEQMKTGLVDGRADLYSTGALLYELLTRKRAFKGYNRDHMPEPTGLNRKFHHPVDAVIFKALAKDPEKRYQSAKEFRVALERAGRVNHLQALFASVTVLGTTAWGIHRVAAPQPPTVNPPPVTAASVPAGATSPPTVPPPPPPPVYPPSLSKCKEDIKSEFGRLDGERKKSRHTPSIAIANSENRNNDPDRMTIVTGPEGYTFYPMGINLAEEAADASQLKLFVRQTKGTEENIELMVSGENAGVGFIQGDTLLYLTANQSLTPNQRQQLKARLKKLFPLLFLYKEEVHILVRRDFVSGSKNTDLSILNGKKVLTDKDSTGSRITATNLLKSKDGTGVQAELETDGGYSAICRVLTRDAQAMVVTAGAPTNLLRAIAGLGAEYAGQLQFLPVQPIKTVGYEVYQEGKILAKDYQWIKEDTPTLSVRSLLMAYNFNPKGTLGKQRCDQINELEIFLRKNLDRLKLRSDTDTTIHPKWKDVELNMQGNWIAMGC